MYVVIYAVKTPDCVWIADTDEMESWKSNGFRCLLGYIVYPNGTIKSSTVQFYWNDSGLTYESFDGLEEAKQAAFNVLGYKPGPTVKDMKGGDIFKIKSTGQICLQSNGGYLTCLDGDNKVLSISSRLNETVERLKIVPDVS